MGPRFRIMLHTGHRRLLVTQAKGASVNYLRSLMEHNAQRCRSVPLVETSIRTSRRLCQATKKQRAKELPDNNLALLK